MPAIFLLLLLACNSNPQTTNHSRDDRSTNTDTSDYRLFFEGRFVSQQKINRQHYVLLLKDSLGNRMEFQTVMPLDEFEISALKPDGNNIRLTYTHLFNPSKKTTEKMVRYMEPVYEFRKK